MNVIELLFPGKPISRGGQGADGLAKDSKPENCIIHDSFIDKYSSRPSERREHFLVTVGDTTVYLRICTAMEGSGYDEFAAILREGEGAVAFFKRQKEGLS